MVVMALINTQFLSAILYDTIIKVLDIMLFPTRCDFLCMIRRTLMLNKCAIIINVGMSFCFLFRDSLHHAFF